MTYEDISEQHRWHKISLKQVRFQPLGFSVFRSDWPISVSFPGSQLLFSHSIDDFGTHLYLFTEKRLATFSLKQHRQGRRSNFEIGGAPLVTQYWGEGGTRHFFLLILYNFKNIEGGHVPPPPPPPHSVVPDTTV